jgi:hypothetical protein
MHHLSLTLASHTHPLLVTLPTAVFISREKTVKVMAVPSLKITALATQLK